MARHDDRQQLEEELRRLRGTSRASKPGAELRQFFIGLVMLGAGIYWLFQKTIVSTSGIFGSGLRFGDWLVPNGTVVIPFFIGILLLFFLEKRIYGWIVTAIGLAIIILSIILSVHIRLTTISMFDYVMMFFLIAGGAGLLLKVLFKSRD